MNKDALRFAFIESAKDAGHMTQLMKLSDLMAAVDVTLFDVFDKQGTIVWSIEPYNVGKKLKTYTFRLTLRMKSEASSIKWLEVHQ